MAFGKKYFSEYKSGNNLEYYCEIWVEGQTAAAVQIEIGEGGPIIEYDTDKNDRFSPIISSSCKFPFLVKNFLFADFIDELRTIYQEREVYLHLYRSPQSGHLLVAPLWSGYLVMDLGSGVDQSFPYDQELVFTDGLSLLKDVDWVNLGLSGGTPPFEERTAGNYAEENMYYGPGRFTYWLKEVLKKTGAATTFEGASQNYRFTTAVNWYNGINNVITQSSDPLYLTKSSMSLFHTKDDNGVFYPDNTYNVLKQILRHWGARITYWKHQFWIVQIPEYIENSSGTITAPININSRVYSNTGFFQGSQPHLGSTYYSRYDQTISNQKISKLTGTQYSYLPRIKNVKADFLSFSSKNYYGGFPFGLTATTQELFQGTINNPSTADFIWLTIPLDWIWDMTGSLLVNGHTNGWWAYIKFNFYVAQEDDATGIITTYYLQYNSSSGSYYWIDSASWVPLGNESPKYIIKSKNISESNYIGFQQKIPFIDDSGNAISMSGAWSFYLDIEDYSSNGSFYCNFSGYGSSQIVRNPQQARNLPSPSGIGNTTSGKVLWANTLQDAQGVANVNIANPNPSGFNAGTGTDDFELNTTSPFMGLLQLLNNTTSASFGQSFDTLVDSNNKDSEEYSFGQLLWGDAVEFSQSALEVYNGTTYQTTDPVGQWGRGILSGNKTFTELLVDEFLTGQTKIVISPSMRLAVGNENKTETIGLNSRPRYVNPIGKLRETRDGVDPEYFFRKGSFYTLLDEWDYEGYQIIRNALSSTTTTNNIGNLGGSQFAQPYSNSMVQNPTTQALMMNSPVAYIRQTVASTGTNVAVNGNFNTAVGWTLGTGWSIDTTAKKAKFTATGLVSDLSQSVLTEELTYQINFRVVVTAGTLLVKAGSSGTTETITASGDYSIYLDCEGSNIIKFQAGTTFTGNITYITIADQKSLSSLPINVIGNAVFKTGDTFNLINSNSSEIMPLIVTSNQGANDDSVSVSSTPLFEDIDPGSFLLINQDDLSEQYQNKTKGTVAGFGIDADGISKGGIEITGWLNSDTMSGAAVTNVPTALSVKNYVDGQVGASDTLQEVTDNGNTTTNDIILTGANAQNTVLGMVKFASTTYPNSFASIIGRTNGAGINQVDLIFNTAYGASTEKMRILAQTGNVGINESNPASKLEITGGNIQLADGWGLRWDDAANTQLLASAGDGFKFTTGGSEKMRLTSGGNLLLGTTVDSGGKLEIAGSGGIMLSNAGGGGAYDSIKMTYSGYNSGNPEMIFQPKTMPGSGVVNTYFRFKTLSNTGSNVANVSIDGTLTGTTATFSGQVTIPATPIATTDAASKSYVDAQVGSADTLSEVLALGNTSGANDIEMALGQKVYFNNHNENIFSNVNGDLQINARTELRIKGNNNNTNGVELSFFNGGSEKMRLLNNGNVLIGTTTDSGEKLQVNGTSSFSGDLLVGSGEFISWGTAGQTAIEGSTASNKLNFLISGSSKMWLNSTGLGIGTSSPSRKLDVEGRIRFSSNSNQAVNGYGEIYTSYSYGKGQIFIAPEAVTNPANFHPNGGVTIGAASTSPPANGLMVAGQVSLSGSLTGTTASFSGQVTIPATPIATTDAASKSYVDAQVGSADTLSEVLALGNTTGGTNINISPSDVIDFFTGANLNYGRIKADSEGLTIDTVANRHMRFMKAGVETMRINTTGNLLVGGTTGGYTGTKIHVGSFSDSQNGINILTSTSGYGYVLFGDGAGADTYRGQITYYHGNDSMSFNANGGEKLRIVSGGGIAFGGATNYGTSGQLLKSNANASPTWVDASTVIGGPYLPLAGGTLSGALTGTTATFSGLVSGITPTAAANFTTKAYVDAQVESADTLQEVTDNGNTTTNSIMIGSSSSPNSKLQIGLGTSNSGSTIAMFGGAGSNILSALSLVNTLGNAVAGQGVSLDFHVNAVYSPTGRIATISESTGTPSSLAFYTYSSGLFEKMRLTSGGSLLINQTSNSGDILQVTGNNNVFAARLNGGTTGGQSYGLRVRAGTNSVDTSLLLENTGGTDLFRVAGDGATTLTGLLTGTTATFSGTGAGTIFSVVRDSRANGFFDLNFNGQLANFDSLTGYTFSRQGVEKLRLSNSGNLLIGTTVDFGSKLNVDGSGRFTGTAFLEGEVKIGTTSGATLNFLRTSANYIGATNATGYLVFRTGGYDTALTLDASQNATFAGSLTGTTGQFTGIGVATTPSAVYKLDVNGKARVQSVLELDDVLTLNAISTPADPASGKSSIWMDTSGDIKVKINVSGTIVTRTIAAFE